MRMELQGRDVQAFVTAPVGWRVWWWDYDEEELRGDPVACFALARGEDSDYEPTDEHHLVPVVPSGAWLEVADPHEMEIIAIGPDRPETEYVLRVVEARVERRERRAAAS